MHQLFTLVGLLVSLCASAQTYYPDAVWQRKAPAEVGIDSQRLRWIDRKALDEFVKRLLAATKG